jgi:hypothetical protein
MTALSYTARSRTSGAAWRRSYDIEDPRAQVSRIHWEASARNENALKFFDVFKSTVWDYSDHIRKPGKPLPISANALAVLRALLRFMDGKTGRCDPCLDTIASRSKLSRRTVVRQLEALRRERVIDWVRRTVKTGKAPGEGPQRKQTSNAYFIDMAKLPIEIARTLRRKLGDRLRETSRKLVGSGPVPSRLAGRAAQLLANLAGSLSAGGNREHAERRALAGGTAHDRLAHMYRDDPDALRQHEEMLGLSSCPGASARLALYPSSRTKG